MIKEMFDVLIGHIGTITSETMDFSELRGERLATNIQQTIKGYELEIKKYAKVVVEQKRYAADLEEKIQCKDKMYIRLFGELSVRAFQSRRPRLSWPGCPVPWRPSTSRLIRVVSV